MNEGKNNPLEQLTDDQILNLISKTPSFDKGFESLLSKYQEKIYWHVRRIANSHEDSNDIVQNTFIKVYKNVSGFKRKSKLYTWLFRIATNEALTFLGNKNKQSLVGINERDLLFENQMVSHDGFSSDEILNLLEAAIKSLPEKQKLVFNMRYYNDLSYQEISDILGTSVGGLKASYHLAVKKLHDILITNL